ncbi:hypothetical protein CISECK363B_06710 [Citrobacter sedlakii]
MKKEVKVRMIESENEKQDLLLTNTDSFSKDLLPETLEQVMIHSNIELKNEGERTSGLTNKSKKLVWLHGFNALSLIMLCLICYYISLNKNEMKVARVYLAGMIDSCPIYMFYRSSYELLPKRVTLTEKMARSKLPCLTGSFYIFQQEDSLIFDEVGRQFISRCSYQAGKKNKLSSCKSVFNHE